MKAKVYKISWKIYQKEPHAIGEILDNFKDKLFGTTAIKTHFGEPGNKNALNGKIIKPIIDWAIKNKVKGFLTDTNTLYTGFRSDSKKHLQTAKKHGFGNFKIPVKIDDQGFPEFRLTKLKSHYKNLPIRLGKKLVEADSILCISHLKGHQMFGFGGTLKNLGMGGAVPAGKLILHAHIAGNINQNLCTLCQTCLRNCPTKAISLIDNKIVIDPNKCIGCGECVTLCPKGAVEVSKKDLSLCQEKTALYAYALMKNKPGIYINYLININPICDCAGQTKPVLTPDLGVMVSDDPVALDQASVDWINEASGKDLFLEEVAPYKHILTTAESLGLGSRRYQTVNLN